MWSAKKIKFTVCSLTPFLLLPLAISPHQESKCAYIILWMAVYWCLEPVHLAVTALLPVVLMPTLGILTGEEVCSNYMKEVLMMFLGGLAVAVAVEHCNLHERLALKVLLLLGTDTKWLMLGFMLTTMFLSMWISNTATTAMMVPIVEAVMMELKSSVQRTTTDSGLLVALNALHKTLLLSIAYSANCGGTGTVTGTSPNMILKGFLEEHKQDEENKKNIRRVISVRYSELGAITFHEMAVLCCFIVLVFLWVFREPKFMSGWADLFSSDTRKGDAVPVIAILFLLFLIPAEPWRIRDSPALLKWSAVQSKLPWGLVLLLGGGFALAQGTQKSGLSKWLGAQMTQLSFLSPSVMQFLLCAFTAGLTEIISNSTVATILLPVVNQMALTFHIHPLYLMLPVTVASSYAFMLPVATGPNAIVFDSGHMKTVDMVKPGSVMNIICCCVQMFMINTLGTVMFNLNTFPSWAGSSNVTEGNWTFPLTNSTREIT
ncbi:Solute carrier family 13 member 2 like protein [Argiope bruennichi]|uniref:Solute carrier family 13 member 2 like protein n=1 Tax=Argiope bruennichi TaxID=94029 RepID=A0A8T0EBY8_ARGBR|nr:Solute carrier family 13 member 2 like protein [Argiope bruennichi]